MIEIYYQLIILLLGLLGLYFLHFLLQTESIAQFGGYSPKVNFGTNVTKTVKQSYPVPFPTTELLHKEISQNMASVIIEDDSDLLENSSDRRYKNPHNMNRLQILKYKRIGNKHHMTISDYTDWLILFKDDMQHLDPVDQVNLKIIARGGTLRDTDRELGPATISALTQYNQKISGREILPTNYDFGRIYEDYDFRTLSHDAYENVLDVMKPLVKEKRASAPARR